MKTKKTFRTLQTTPVPQTSNELSTIQEITLNAIIDGNLHIKIARACIKSIACSEKSNSAKACQDIVNRGFTETIVQDIEQDMFITLFNMMKAEYVYYDEWIDRLIFSNFINDKDEEQNYYVFCKRSVNATLASYKTSVNQNKHQIVSYDALLTDESGAEYALSWNNANYTRATVYMGCTNDLLADERFIAIMKYVKSKVSEKRWNVIVKVVAGLLENKTYQVISDENGFSFDQVRYAREILKKLYMDYGTIELTHNKSYRFGGSIKGFNKWLSNETCGTGFYSIGNMGYKPIDGKKADIVISHKGTDYKARKIANKELGKLVAMAIKNPSIMAIDNPNTYQSLVEKWNDKTGIYYDILTGKYTDKKPVYINPFYKNGGALML